MSQLIQVFRCEGPARANVIFVHGLGGHPYDTWRRGAKDVNADQTFWPRWLARDVKGLNVYCLGYSASASGWTGQTMPIEDRARNIAQLLYRENDLTPAPIVFVCHSLGGLLVKRLILELSERKALNPQAALFFGAVRQVVFMATPHTGSYQAGLLDWLRLLLWPTQLAKAMISDAATLRQINTSYRIVARERDLTLSHLILFETRSTALGMIVREGSADPGLNDSEPVGIDADHIRIAKPRDSGSLAYRIVRDFVNGLSGGNATSLGETSNLPPFDGEPSWDYLGAALRLVGLAMLAFCIVLLWPKQQIPTETQISIALALIENVDQRLATAKILLGRPLSSDEVSIISRLRLSAEYQSTLPAPQVRRIRQSSDPEELKAAIASLQVQQCDVSHTYKIAESQLRCSDGTPLPMVLSANIGPPLIERKALVFHYSAGLSAENQIRGFSGKVGAGINASVHLVVARNGSVVQLVPFNRQAMHAGLSEWKGLKNLNAYSIGIDLTNIGQLVKKEDGSFVGEGQIVPADRVVTVKAGAVETYWEAYTPEQIKTAEALVRAFRAEQPNIEVLGHSEIAPDRKIDPGPAFPLNRLKALK